MTSGLFLQAILKFIFGAAVVGVLIFVPAGTLYFWNAWLLMLKKELPYPGLSAGIDLCFGKETITTAPAQYAAYFTARKQKWLPLYLELKSRFGQEGLPFEEHFPKMGIIWRKSSAFVIVYPKVTGLVVSFCCDGIDPEIPAVRHMTVSPHRVTHYVQVTDNSGFEQLIQWMRRSYLLTQK